MAHDIASPHQTTAEQPPINWLGASVLISTPILALLIIPTYAWFADYSTAAWVSFILLSALNGMSITGGYHRLWAHRAYEAHWSLSIFYMLFGAMATQNSILVWASGHRTHHRHVDHVDNDPYSSKRGFWFSHIGWMLRQYESGKEDFRNAPDLLSDPIVMFQHKNYLSIVLAMNVGLPLIIGFMVGDVWGVLLLGGLLRLVWSHHTTFFINSLAHMWGSRPYTDENTARDNGFLALFTYGEGYHNYHHIFQYDYRNGIRWYHFDPTKWMILVLSWIGITRNLKRCPEFAIEKAKLTMQFKRAETKISLIAAGHAQLDAWRARLAQESDHFSQVMADWSQLKEAWYSEKKRQLLQKWEEATFHNRFEEIEYRLKMQRKRLRMLTEQVTA
jgi:stearoyl-CoA desaturase (delta-9 desaturase)